MYTYHGNSLSHVLTTTRNKEKIEIKYVVSNDYILSSKTDEKGFSNRCYRKGTNIPKRGPVFAKSPLSLFPMGGGGINALRLFF